MMVELNDSKFHHHRGHRGPIWRQDTVLSRVEILHMIRDVERQKQCDNHTVPSQHRRFTVYFKV